MKSETRKLMSGFKRLNQFRLHPKTRNDAATKLKGFRDKNRHKLSQLVKGCCQ